MSSILDIENNIDDNVQLYMNSFEDYLGDNQFAREIILPKTTIDNDGGININTFLMINRDYNFRINPHYIEKEIMTDPLPDLLYLKNIKELIISLQTSYNFQIKNKPSNINNHFVLNVNGLDKLLDLNPNFNIKNDVCKNIPSIKLIVKWEDYRKNEILYKYIESILKDSYPNEIHISVSNNMLHLLNLSGLNCRQLYYYINYNTVCDFLNSKGDLSYDILNNIFENNNISKLMITYINNDHTSENIITNKSYEKEFGRILSVFGTNYYYI